MCLNLIAFSNQSFGFDFANWKVKNLWWPKKENGNGKYQCAT